MNATKLHTGDILHCTGNGTLSKIIRWITSSKFSHSAMFIEIWGQPYIIDAQNDGVNVRPFDIWKKKYGYTFIVHRSPLYLDPKEIAKRAMTKVGNTGYDFISLIFKHPFKLIFGTWRMKNNQFEKMTCSEYVAWVYGANKAYRMSPEDLHQWCIINNYEEVNLN